MPEPNIRKNYIYNTVYQVATMIVPLITAPYASRVFSASGIGIYSFTGSVSAFFILFAALGTVTYGQREIAQHRHDRQARSKLFWEIELLSVLSTLAALALWLVLVLSSGEYRPYYAVLMIGIAAVAFDISWFFSGLEQFPLIVTRNLAVKLIGVAALFLVIKRPSDLLLYIGILASTQLLGNVVMWASLPRHLGKVDPRSLSLKGHLRETFVYFIPTIASSVYTMLDKTMIGVITQNTDENGYYEQATKITRLAYLMVSSINTVMMSRMSYLFKMGRYQEIRSRLEKSIRFIMTLSIPMSYGIIGISDNFVPWFFGDGFEGVSLLLKLSGPLVILMSLHNFLSSQVLLPSGQRSRSTKGVILGAAVNFLMNILLIPRFQSAGAAIGTLTAEAAICGVYLYMSKEYVTLWMILKRSARQFVAGACMLIVILALGGGQRGFLTTVVQIAAGGIAYFSLLLALREPFTTDVWRRSWSSLLKRIKY